MFSKIHPEEHVTEYGISKGVTREHRSVKEWELLRNPKLQLDQARRELIFAEDNLEEQRENLRNFRKEVDAQWMDLEVKEGQLKENFRNFSKFVKENLEKRNRAETQIQDDQELLEQRQKQVDDAKKKIVATLASKELLDAALKEHKIYENFLHQVVEKTAEFKSSDAIISRYDTFKTAQNEIILAQRVAFRALENARNEMKKLMKSSQMILMGLHNQLTNSSTRFDEAVMKSGKWESVVYGVKEASLQQNAQIKRVKRDIWEVYLQICGRKKVPPTMAEEDFDGQLRAIKATLLQLKKVNRMAAKKVSAHIGERDVKGRKANYAIK